MGYALQVFKDGEDHQYHWAVLEEHPDDSGTFTPYSGGECGFSTFADALNAGTLALARAEGEPYENEAADPVGDADCEVAAEPAPAGRSSNPYRSQANPRARLPTEPALRPGQTSTRYGERLVNK